MNSIISWIGGKKSIREFIYQRFPKSYGRYIEVFGGGGWVLFGKKPERDLEVYNDFDSNLANMFSVIRDQPLAFINELGYLPLNGREIFNLYKSIIQLQRIEEIEYGLPSDGMLTNWIKSYKENRYAIVERKTGNTPIMKITQSENKYKVITLEEKRAVVQARKNRQPKKK